LIRLGEFEVTSLYENRFRVDGGSMFGIIPKKLWSKIMPSDADNFVFLDIRPLLIRTGKNNVLIDLGFGNCLDSKMKRIYGLDQNSRLLADLDEAKITPEEIDTVIFSHLHADHALGGLGFNRNGQVIKLFPNAKYYAHKYELEDSLNPNERTAAAYVTELLAQYEEIQAVENDGRIVDGISVLRTGGHTRGHMAIVIQSAGQTLIYPGDIIPTTAHLKPAYIGAVDTFPLESLVQKKAIMDECIKNNYYMAFDHDSKFEFAKLIKDNDEIVPVSLFE